jgi:hypothetical protein
VEILFYAELVSVSLLKKALSSKEKGVEINSAQEKRLKRIAC